MCGRFTLRTTASALIDQFGLPADDAVFSEWLPRYNVAPTQKIFAIRRNADHGAEPVMLRWGLIPSWAKDVKIGNRMINARAETVSSKPSFRNAFRRKRCLVIADGYYEWQKTGGAKQPFFFHSRSQQPFAFAGLWESWSGELDQQQTKIDSCTIITTTPNSLAAEVHDRMPVILSDEASRRWLNEDEPTDQLQALLCPAAEDLLVADPVGTFVNSPTHDGPACIEPL